MGGRGVASGRGVLRDGQVTTGAGFTWQLAVGREMWTGTCCWRSRIRIAGRLGRREDCVEMGTARGWRSCEPGAL